MKTIFKSLFVGALAGTLLGACNKNPNANPNPNPNVAFQSIVFNGAGNAYLSPGSNNAVSKITGVVVTSCTNGVLTVSGLGDIYIDVKNLDSLIANGAINVTSKNTLNLTNTIITGNAASNIVLSIKGNAIRANANGYKNFVLTGTSADVYVTETGVGTFSGFGFAVNNAYVTVAGIHDCEVNASSTLHATIIGIGNIYYKGNPVITPKITGLGQVIKK